MCLDITAPEDSESQVAEAGTLWTSAPAGTLWTSAAAETLWTSAAV